MVVGLATFLGVVPEQTKQDATDSSVPARTNWRLTLQVGLHTVGGWDELLGTYCSQYKLQAAQTVSGGGALELVYDCVAAKGARAAELVAGLNALPNVESVAIKER
jgi:hypothetical protein